MTWLYKAKWKAMNAQQKVLEDLADKDYIDFCRQRFREARESAIEYWKEENKNLPRSEQKFFSNSNEYAGAFFIVYGSSQTHTNLYSSFYQRHLENINHKLEKYFNIRGFVGKVSLMEPIQIVDIMKEIKYPAFDLTKGARDYSCYVRLGMWPHENH